jgi:CCR4-NOT transcription complex subunit 2
LLLLILDDQTLQGGAGSSEQKHQTNGQSQQSEIGVEEKQGSASVRTPAPPGLAVQFQDRLQRTDNTSNDVDAFSLTGLLNFVRNEPADQVGLALGQDLTLLGLDLNSPE